MVDHIPHPVKEKSARRFPEISRQAKALGVHRYHLWCVLTARRASPTLVARYEALTGKPHVFPAPAVPVAPHNAPPKGPNA